MKTLYTLLIFLTSAICKAQGVEIYLAGETTDISGTTQSVLCTGNITHLQLDVLNLTGTDQPMKITRKIITPLPGTEDQLCWGVDGGEGHCYGFDVMAGIPEYTTPDEPYIFNNTLAVLLAYHRGNGNAGVVVYRYYVVDSADMRIDSVDLEFTAFAGLDDQHESDFKIWANSEKQTLVVESSNNQSTFQLFDLQGKVIFSSTLWAGINEFDQPFAAGTYIFIADYGTREHRGKIVVR